MIQLTFTAAFDPFHAVFRILRLRSGVHKVWPLHRDTIRILDFYLLFPFRIGGIRLLPRHRKYRSLSEAYQWTRPYGEQPDDANVFARMEPIQGAALETLAAYEFLRREPSAPLQIDVTNKEVPKPVLERVSQANERDSTLIEFLNAIASEYPLFGPDGLKARSRLLEFRHDVI